jgi:hypothetical protein
VELVSRTGDDANGDSLILALTRAGVGHAAVLRDPSRPTLVLEPPPPEDETALVAAATDRPPAIAAAALRPDAGDVSLGLSYLTAFAALVVTDDVADGVVAVAAEAATFAGAHLIVLLPAGQLAPEGLPANATALAAPDEADDGEFGALVGVYAAALDGGAAPAEAFAAATAGWEALPPA